MKTPALFAVLMFINYALLTVNFRAIAKGWIGWVVATDALIAICGWTIFRMIQEAHAPAEMAGYVFGACAGSSFAIVLTQKVFRES